MTHNQQQRIDALLNTLGSMDDPEAEMFAASGAPTSASPAAGTARIGAITVLVGVGLAMMLAYQTWLIHAQNRQLRAQNAAREEQSSLMKAQNEQLAAQNALLKSLSASFEAQNKRLAVQDTALQTQIALLKNADQRGRTQIRRIQNLSRRLNANALRSAVVTLTEVRPCDGQAVEGPTVIKLCPAASARARQEAFDSYVSLVRAGGRSALDLSNLRLDQLSLVAANLRNADLRGASLDAADLQGTDVRGANFAASRGLVAPTQWCFDNTTSFPAAFAPGTSAAAVCRPSRKDVKL